MKAEESGVHFGLGVEDGGGDFEVDFGGGVELEDDAEYTVVLLVGGDCRFFCGEDSSVLLLS